LHEAEARVIRILADESVSKPNSEQFAR